MKLLWRVFFPREAQDPNTHTHPDRALPLKAGSPHSTLSKSRALEKTNEPRLQAQAALVSGENKENRRRRRKGVGKERNMFRNQSR